jgi:hypothetical protein
MLLFGLSAGLSAQTTSSAWYEVPQMTLRVSENTQVPIPSEFRLFQLNKDILENQLRYDASELESAVNTHRKVIELPFPDEGFYTFSLVAYSSMHPDLAAKYPEIKSYRGYCLEDPSIQIYCSYTPLGFTAIVMGADAGNFLIEPVHVSDKEHYMCYFYRDIDLQFPYECHAPDKVIDLGSEASVAAGDCNLRTYRLAIAATAEFTAAAGGVANALANIAATVTIVNGIYINELSVQCQLVGNNDQILFTDTNTDGLTDGNQNTLAGQSQGAIESVLDAGDYDIGHTVGTRMNGGWAGVSNQIGNVCTGNKADAATTFNPVPIPAGFAMGFMHEWGHQFGARHTFNANNAGSCTPGQQSASAAYEPGSGCTIMSYAGTCDALNVIGSRDQYFHAINLREIGNYVTAGNGNSCPVTVVPANGAPNVNAPAVAVYNLPISTPFSLTATASDPDGDALTYCWEQWNNELISHPPACNVDEGPVFRSFPPTASATRFFPNLIDLIAGNPTPWEVLPCTDRTMAFRVTVRDNAAGAGCTDEDDVNLEFFADAGPFRVTLPADDDCYAAEGPMTVNWDVAGTDGGDVNCSEVDIMLSIDGGFTYPFTLLAGTPNDGAQDVSLPDVLTEQARVMVRCSDNIFFNISPGDFSIECISNLVVTDDPAIGTYEARQQLSTSGTVTVPAFAVTEFFAGVEVVLNPGFSALRDCDFLARIQPCMACDGSRPGALALDGEIIDEEQPVIHIHYLDESTASARAVSGTQQRLTVFPNPFDNQFTIRLDLVEPGEVNLDVVDMSGRSIQMIYEKTWLAAGSYNILVPAASMPTGMYECRITTANGQEQVKLVKMR